MKSVCTDKCLPSVVYTCIHIVYDAIVVYFYFPCNGFKYEDNESSSLLSSHH